MVRYLFKANDWPPNWYPAWRECEDVIQRAREDNPVAYCKARVSLVPKNVSVEGHSSQMPIQTQSMAATMAFLEQIISESENSSGSSQPAKDDSETYDMQ